MSTSKSSILFDELLSEVNTTIEKEGVDTAIALFAEKVRLLLEPVKIDNTTTLELIVQLGVKIIEHSGYAGPEKIEEINTIAKQYHLPHPLIRCVVVVDPTFKKQKALYEKLIAAGVFEKYEALHNDTRESIDIDNPEHLIDYLSYLELSITDIPSLYAYIRMCITVSQMHTDPDEVSILEQYITRAAIDTADSELDIIRDSYDYLSISGVIAREYYQESLMNGISEEDASFTLELYIRQYAWIHHKMLWMHGAIIEPRITSRKVDGDLENLSDGVLYGMYNLINDWMDILDPERYIPDRMPMRERDETALYIHEAGTHYRNLQ